MRSALRRCLWQQRTVISIVLAHRRFWTHLRHQKVVFKPSDRYVVVLLPSLPLLLTGLGRQLVMRFADRFQMRPFILHNLTKPADQAKLAKIMGRLFYFDPGNPSGRYRLHLDRPFERRLAVCSRWLYTVFTSSHATPARCCWWSAPMMLLQMDAEPTAPTSVAWETCRAGVTKPSMERSLCLRRAGFCRAQVSSRWITFHPAGAMPTQNPYHKLTSRWVWPSSMRHRMQFISTLCADAGDRTGASRARVLPCTESGSHVGQRSSPYCGGRHDESSTKRR